MVQLGKNESRKVVLINPRFQIRFMTWMGALAVGVVAVMHLAHSWFFFQLRRQAMLAGLPKNHVFFQFISDRQRELGFITVGTFFVVLAASVVVGLVLSHKIAGPMYRLKVHFDSVAESGKAKPVSFREGDFFQEIPEAYNRQFKESTEFRRSA